jgi:hypothetical protein
MRWLDATFKVWLVLLTILFWRNHVHRVNVDLAICEQIPNANCKFVKPERIENGL